MYILSLEEAFKTMFWYCNVYNSCVSDSFVNKVSTQKKRKCTLRQKAVYQYFNFRILSYQYEYTVSLLAVF